MAKSKAGTPTSGGRGGQAKTATKAKPGGATRTQPAGTAPAPEPPRPAGNTARPTAAHPLVGATPAPLPRATSQPGAPQPTPRLTIRPAAPPPKPQPRTAPPPKTAPPAPPAPTAVRSEAELPVRQFRLNDDAGPHHEAGIDINPGEVIETHLDLAKMFPNKWKEVKDGKYVGEGAIPEPKNRLAAGRNPSNFVRDEGFDPGRADNLPAEALIPQDGDETEVEDEETDTGTGGEEEDSPHGTDVTETFPAAKKADLRVFRADSGLFTVVDSEEQDKPLHSDELRSEEDVTKFLADYGTE